ncbi:hypothetical protein [Pseudoalteromonas shioyasakiensis]|uniref:hypothetical protein n=1 Tax=Pseudoalteromonas shioyasakiensis TaxID=1190813 RepID=UPI0022B1D99F|nr:hypothetical protein [Pseudoalteromonas shioyasakiensis]MCZ4251455.1 hypothetical protein [Pseudoalteromonas shioyasakiensis]
MPRLDTRLEAEGAEFLVLGQLLLHKIATYKTYTNMPGYDLVATNPESNKSAMVQVKSRWRTGANGFPIKNFDCDFVVVVLLNRGSKCGKKEILPPKYYIFPVSVIQSAPRSADWGKVNLNTIPDLASYEDRWDLVAEFLGETMPNK